MSTMNNLFLFYFAIFNEVVLVSACGEMLDLMPMNSESLLEHSKRLPPRNPAEPFNVNLGFYVESLGNFRHTEMTFDVDLYLYLSWTDSRLQHLDDEDVILVNTREGLEKLWKPDLYFANARTSYFHDVTVPNFNLFIDRNGTVAYSTRVTLNLACHLFLAKYPLDYQHCLIKIISYAYVKSEMNVSWFDFQPIRYNPEINLPEFQISAIDNQYCNGEFMYVITENNYRLGNFSCLLGVIQLKRSIGYHLVQSYIPTGLIVIVSWVSFWIDRRAVPARVSLSFTTLLTLSTQGNGLRYALPPVSYAKAIDFWYGACMLFIFGSLLEFAIVNSLMRRSSKFDLMAQRFRCKCKRRDHVFPGTVFENDESSNFVNENNNHAHPASKFKTRLPKMSLLERVRSVTSKYRMNSTFDRGEGGGDPRFKQFLDNNGNSFDAPPSASHIEAPYHTTDKCTIFALKASYYSRKGLQVDKTSRILFPALFLVFNLFYWWFYLVRDVVDDTLDEKIQP